MIKVYVGAQWPKGPKNEYVISHIRKLCWGINEKKGITKKSGTLG